MAELKLGINLAFAKKRWPEPEAWLKIVKKFGLMHVEFCSDLLDPVLCSEPSKSKIAKRIKRLVKAEGIEIFDYYTGVITHSLNMLSHPEEGLRKDAITWCQGAIELAHLLGAKGIGGHFDAIPVRVLKDKEKKKIYINRLIKYFWNLSYEAKKTGLSFILWEQMYTPDEVPHTIEEAKRIYQEVNKKSVLPIYLTVDLGHSCCQNYPHKKEDRSPYRWLKELASVSPVIHLQQTDGKSSPHWPFTKKYNKIGIIKAEKVIEVIEKSGSKENYLILEIFWPQQINEKQLLSELEESVKYWRKYVKG